MEPRKESFTFVLKNNKPSHIFGMNLALFSPKLSKSGSLSTVNKVNIPRYIGTIQETMTLVFFLSGNAR